MNTRPLVLKTCLAVSAVASAFILTACPSTKITEEQAKQLVELRRQQASLGEKIKLKASEISRLEGEIAEREKAVAKCTEEKLALEQRLAKWPNAWPDYTEPAKDTTSATTKKKSK